MCWSSYLVHWAVRAPRVDQLWCRVCSHRVESRRKTRPPRIHFRRDSQPAWKQAEHSQFELLPSAFPLFRHTPEISNDPIEGPHGPRVALRLTGVTNLLYEVPTCLNRQCQPVACLLQLP